MRLTPKQSAMRIRNFDFRTTGESARTEAVTKIFAIEEDDRTALLAKCVLDLRDRIVELESKLAKTG
jgi:hypothetical protein